MSASQPSHVLNTLGFKLTFDEETNIVTNSSKAQRRPMIERVQNIIARRQISEWLTDWAIWMDRDNEIGIIAPDLWRNAAALRTEMNLDLPAHEWSPPWVRTATMPRHPAAPIRRIGLGKFIARWIGQPERLARGVYRRRNDVWVDGELARWAEIRESSLEAYKVDQQFEAVKRQLSDQLDQQDIATEINFAFNALLGVLSTYLSLRRVSLDRPGELAVDVESRAFTAISQSRHMPSPQLDSLIVEEGPHVRAERFAQLGCILCLAFADLVGVVRSSRRKIALSLYDDSNNASQPRFVSRYEIGPVLGGASHIISEIARRRRPNIPGWTIYIAETSEVEFSK